MCIYHCIITSASVSFKCLCIFGPKGAIQIRYYYYYYYYYSFVLCCTWWFIISDSMIHYLCCMFDTNWYKFTNFFLQRRCQEDPVSLPSGRLEKTTRSSPHHVTQHRPTGSETTPPYAPRSSRFGSELPSVEDDVDVWRYAIVSYMPETTTSCMKSCQNVHTNVNDIVWSEYDYSQSCHSL